MSVYPKGSAVVPSSQPSVAPSKTPAPSPSVAPSKAPATEGITFEYKKSGDWGSGFMGEIVVTNKSNQTLNNWTFTLDSNVKVTNAWGGRFCRTDW